MVMRNLGRGHKCRSLSPRPPGLSIGAVTVRRPQARARPSPPPLRPRRRALPSPPLLPSPPRRLPSRPRHRARRPRRRARPRHLRHRCADGTALTQQRAQQVPSYTEKARASHLWGVQPISEQTRRHSQPLLYAALPCPRPNVQRRRRRAALLWRAVLQRPDRRLPRMRRVQEAASLPSCPAAKPLAPGALAAPSLSH